MHMHRYCTLVALAIVTSCGDGGDASDVVGPPNDTAAEDTQDGNVDTDVPTPDLAVEIEADVDLIDVANDTEADSDPADATNDVDTSNDASDDGGVPAEVASATIGEAGGTLVSLDGVVTITVPPDAVDADTVFTIERLTDAPAGTGGERLLEAYRLGPEDVIFFEQVTVAFTYPDTALGGVAESDLVVLVLDDGAWVEAVPNEVDTTANRVSAKRWHFSNYSAGTPPPGAVVDVGETIYVADSGLPTGSGSLVDPVPNLEAACSRAVSGLPHLVDGTFYTYSQVKTVYVGAGTFSHSGLLTCLHRVVGAGRDSTLIEGALFMRDSPLSGVTIFGRLILENARAENTTIEGSVLLDHSSLDLVSVIGDPGDPTYEFEPCVQIVQSDYGAVGISNSTIEYCETGIEVESFQSVPIRLTAVAVRQSSIGLLANDEHVEVSNCTFESNDTGVVMNEAGKFNGNIVRDNRLGLTNSAPTMVLRDNVFSCNRAFDVSTLASAPLDAAGNLWDHVPPHSPTTGDEGPFSNDINLPDSNSTFGARLAERPCRRPKRQTCTDDEQPPATATFGTDYVCKRGNGGVITCGGTASDRTNVCEVEIPPVETPTTCAGSAFVIEGSTPDPAAPASLTIDTVVNGCTATRTETGYTTVSENASTGVTSVDACDFRTATGQSIGRPAAPETANASIIGTGTPVIADGPDTQIQFGNFEAFNGSIIWSVEYGAPSAPEATGSILDSIAEVYVPSAPGIPGAPSVPSVRLVPDAVQDYLENNDVEAKRVRICLSNNAYDTTQLPDERLLQLACVRCVSLTKDVFEACREEVCDGRDNDCDSVTDEGCPYTLRLQINGIEGELVGRESGVNTWGSSAACGTYNAMTGAVIVSGSDGKIWQFEPNCGFVRLAPVDTSTAPYTYTVLANDGTPMAYSSTGVVGIDPPTSATIHTPECPAGMVVSRLLGEAGDDIAKLQLECTRLEVTRGTGNVWTVVAGATQLLPVVGTGSGAPFSFAPAPTGGMPRVVTGLRVRYPQALGPDQCCGALTTLWGRANGLTLTPN